MKRTMILLAILLFCVSPDGRAEQQEHLQLANDFSEVLGIQAMFQSLMLQTQNSLDQQTAQMMEQLKNQQPGLPEKVFDEMEVVFRQYMSKVMNAWAPEEAAKIYAQALAEGLPPESLNSAIAHYRTQDGQNELKAINQAASRLNEYVTGNIQKASSEGLTELLGEIKAIVERAKQSLNQGSGAAQGEQ